MSSSNSSNDITTRSGGGDGEGGEREARGTRRAIDETLPETGGRRYDTIRFDTIQHDAMHCVMHALQCNAQFGWSPKAHQTQEILQRRKKGGLYIHA